VHWKKLASAGTLVVLILAGCSAGAPTPDEMARVVVAAGPTAMQQAFGGMAVQFYGQGGQMSDQQMAEGLQEPFYQAAERCGMSRDRFRAGIQRMQTDAAYAEAVNNASSALMLQQLVPQ